MVVPNSTNIGIVKPGGKFPREPRDIREDDICGIDGGAHQWKITPYAKYIGRGECDCGAIRFFANAIDYIIIKRVEEYNEKRGRPGRLYKGPPLIKKEEPMGGTIKEKDLRPETREKIKTTMEEKLSPIPPRPDLTGLTKQQAAQKMRAYYKENKAAIEADRELLGDKRTVKRWGIPSSSWYYMKHVWDGKTAVKDAIQPLTPAPISEATKHAPVPKSTSLPAATELPPFPEFQKDWGNEVQIQWLQSYAQIFGINKNTP